MSECMMKLENQICFSLYKAQKTMTAAYRPLLQPLGLTYPQYIVMLALWELERGGSISVSELGSKLTLDSGTLTPLLKRLESTGLIQRTRSREDERSVLLKLTQAGSKLERAASEVPMKMFCQSGLKQDKLSQLKTLLDEVAGNLGAAK